MEIAYICSMSKEEIQNIIINYLRNFNPELIGLFGSFVRNDHNENSDIDILVKFHEACSLLQIIKIENELSEKIGIKVDLITDGSLKNNRIRRSINQDLQIIYKA